ncbi:CBS domain-containing protein [Bizionia saleffrena]|uniref:CBS domain-containing protein n=1 Tax=Bizionia saleffrena TaxID=291189 RepID=A0A8H2LDE5_9FLAO|nr:CBS domain-containing protein [Bizionia saleffrena]TYB71786.1 CBS domain-containing protein [Bizionia saleffrena]
MGIKSFQGVRKDQNQDIEKELFKVSDFMTTDLITFKASQSVEEVIDILIKYKISGGPVVNDNYELVGIISEGDCIKQISESRYHNLPMTEDSIEKYMAKNIETIDGNLNVFDAAKQFLDSKRRRFPIVKEGKLVGQISQKDILKAAIKLKGQNYK